MQPHDLYSLHGSPSTSHRCFMTFTGCGCLSGLSLNLLCLSTVACTVWLAIPCTRAAPCGRHRLTTTTALRIDICARSAIDASCYHRRPFLRRRRFACMEHSAGRRHVIVITACLQATSQNSYSQTLTCDIVINCLTSVKCSRSFFNCTALKKYYLIIIIIIMIVTLCYFAMATKAKTCKSM